MKAKDTVKLVLASIKDVKFRAKAAASVGALTEYRQLMGDLIALEVLLTIEATKLVDELELIA